MGSVIQFPKRKEQRVPGARAASDRCEGIFHVFVTRGTTCQCGEYRWSELEIAKEAIGIHEPR